MTIPTRLVALAAASALAACGGDFENVHGSSSGSGSEGNVRLVNASQTSFLDLLEGTGSLRAGVPLYSASGYVALSSGSHTLTLREQGTATTLASTAVSIGRDTYQTVVASTSMSVGTLTTTVLSEDESTPDNGQAKLRVLNTADADAGDVDVYVVTTACTALAANAAVTVASATAVATAYVQVTASATAYHVCVTAAGNKADLRLDLPAVTLTDQRIATLILARSAAGVMSGLVLDQQGSLTNVPPAAS